MNLFAVSERIRSTPFLAWGVCFVAFAGALAVRFLFDHTLPPGFPYLTFFPAVIITAFLGGFWPGVVCAIASGLSAWYWFINPAYSFALNPNTAIALIFYAFIVAVDIALIQSMHKAMRGLREERLVTERLYGQQRAMFQELQHRVANNMQFVSSLLGLQKRKAAQNPSSAALAFDEARERLDTMGRVHRRLYDPETVNLPVKDYLRDLCGDVLRSADATHVRCEVEAPEIRFDLERLTTLSLVVVEALTNVLKHAFKGRAEGHVRISLASLEAGRMRLIVADNGVGLPEAADLAQSRSLGQRILQSLAGQLDGELRYVNDAGARMELDFDTTMR